MGLISHENLKLAFVRAGVDISDEEVSHVIAEVDFKQIGKVDFDEFKTMMIGD
jgi:Ca2+-binding EF-hand superfamily protein